MTFFRFSSRQIALNFTPFAPWKAPVAALILHEGEPPLVVAPTPLGLRRGRRPRYVVAPDSRALCLSKHREIWRTA
ncbi:hypothetical protein EC9_02790 [Rosistilla ulvae]|uniref:Uncharacterized protein n=1 Tax=Rosistilla ulvae TaxID=1930277 RepID=A0A517LU15_9BACT|nr:hypothetical protein EC9_02790 [Rosistilla ulvae]